MALIAPTLIGGLVSVLSQPGDNATQKASQFSLAYNAYALSAMALTLVPVFTGTEQPAFMSKILPVFNNPNSTKIDFANAVADAVETFWFIPPVPFSTPPLAGAVTSFPGKPVLVSEIISILSNAYKSAAPVATDIALALDTATKTVVVTYAPPPGSTATLV